MPPTLDRPRRQTGGATSKPMRDTDGRERRNHMIADLYENGWRLEDIAALTTANVSIATASRAVTAAVCG